MNANATQHFVCVKSGKWSCNYENYNCSMRVHESLWKFHIGVHMVNKENCCRKYQLSSRSREGFLTCYCLQLESDVWTSTFASHLSTSGKAGGCRQGSGCINDYLQRVSPRAESPDLSPWRKQSMDCCSAQSGAFSSCLLPTRCVQKAGHVHMGREERRPRDALRLLPFPPWMLTSSHSACVITSRKQLFYYDIF